MNIGVNILIIRASRTESLERLLIGSAINSRLTLSLTSDSQWQDNPERKRGSHCLSLVNDSDNCRQNI